MNVIDLFCGAGGLSKGFMDAGFDIIVGVDNDKDGLNTFSLNHNGAVAMNEDLSKQKTFDKIKQRQPSGDTLVGRAGHRHNDNIEIIWDDGTTMTGLLEGSIPKMVNGVLEQYPKQISTTPKKSELGKYLRERMGIKEGKAITYADLQSYGGTSIDVSLQGEGIYFFDFSVDKSDSSGSTAKSLVQSFNKYMFSTPDTDKNIVAEERGKYGESRKGDK